MLGNVVYEMQSVFGVEEAKRLMGLEVRRGLGFSPGGFWEWRSAVDSVGYRLLLIW